MNEEQKNIETCLPEDILSEVANVPTDPHFVSLTDEALDPLKQQALRQAGYDGYKEVVMYHQPYTFTSQVKQMKSNLILLLRRLWRYPFGRGTTASSDAGSSASSAAGSSASAAAPIRSLADMWQHYITRLKGNPEYGIPSRLSSLTDLPSAPALLADRKISGVPEAEDGISLVHLMGDSSSLAALSEFTDDNVGWELNTNLPSYMQKGKRFELGCRYATGGITLANGNTNLEEIVLPYFEGLRPDITYWRNTLAIASGCPNVTRIYAPKLKTLCTYQHDFAFSGFDYLEELNVPSFEKYLTEYGYGLVGNCKSLKKLYAPKYTYNNVYSGLFKDMPALEYAYLPSITDLSHNYYGYSVSNCPELHTLVLGVMTGSNAASLTDCPKLVHLEFASVVRSIDISGWNPTTALSNNLQQFLSNFKTYIAERLTDKGSGLTLTLSQEVRNAIHAAEDEYGIENIIITQKGWTISPAPN